MARRFTLAEAQSLIPRVDRLLREAVSLKSQYQEAEEAVQAVMQRVTLMGGMMVDRDRVIDSKNRRDETRSKLGTAIEQVQEVGCVVNGPGESKHSNIGISLPGTFEEPKAPVFVDGHLMTTLKGDHIVAEFIGILNDYVTSHYAV